MDIFDPLSPEMVRDPYPVYATLRETDPVHRYDRLGAWVLSRHADCLRVLQDVETFRSDFRVVGEQPEKEQLTLQSLDPPEHTGLRKVVMAALRKNGLDEVTDQLETFVEKRLGELDLRAFDFIGEFAEPVAIACMCAYFGAPPIEDEETFRAAQRALLVSMDSGLAPETFQSGIDARVVLGELLESWLRMSPSTGLLHHVDLSGSLTPRPYVINALRGVFGAGYGSSSSMWGNAMHALLSHGLLDGEEPLDVTAAGFNELIRYDGAVQAESRAVADDTEIAGQLLRHGDIVVTLLGSANRDPAQFDAPERLVLDRAPNPHLGFGRGIHSCLGGHLAVRIGTLVFQHLARHFSITPLDDAVRRPTATLRGFDRLMVSARPRQPARPSATRARPSAES